MTNAQFGELLTELRRISASLARLEALAGKGLNVEPFPPAEKGKCASHLIAALAENFGRSVFSARDVPRQAREQRAASERLALSPSALVAAMDAEQIQTPRQMARYLAGHQGRGVARAGRDERGNLWQMAETDDG